VDESAIRGREKTDKKKQRHERGDWGQDVKMSVKAAHRGALSKRKTPFRWERGERPPAGARPARNEEKKRNRRLVGLGVLGEKKTPGEGGGRVYVKQRQVSLGTETQQGRGGRNKDGRRKTWRRRHRGFKNRTT